LIIFEDVVLAVPVMKLNTERAFIATFNLGGDDTNPDEEMKSKGKQKPLRDVWRILTQL